MTGKVTVQYEDFDLTDGDYPLPKGERSQLATLHIWTQSDGQWCCLASDHGPFCRRCVKLDPTHAALLTCVLEGTLEMEDDPARGQMFWTSETGRTRVETAIRRGGFGEGLDG